MVDKEAIVRKQEKAAAKALEYSRKAQAAKKTLSEIERKEDTRRKILAGSWALDRAEKSEEFQAAMQRELGGLWLVRDDDRELFGFEPLSEAEKEKRGINRVPEKPVRKKSNVIVAIPAAVGDVMPMQAETEEAETRAA